MTITWSRIYERNFPKNNERAVLIPPHADNKQGYNPPPSSAWPPTSPLSPELSSCAGAGPHGLNIFVKSFYRGNMSCSPIIFKRDPPVSSGLTLRSGCRETTSQPDYLTAWQDNNNRLQIHLLYIHPSAATVPVLFLNSSYAIPPASSTSCCCFSRQSIFHFRDFVA